MRIILAQLLALMMFVCSADAAFQVRLGSGEAVSVTYRYDGFGGDSLTQSDTAPAHELSRSNRTYVITSDMQASGTIDSLRLYIGASGMTGDWSIAAWTSSSDEPWHKICETATQTGGSSGWSNWLECTLTDSESMDFTSPVDIKYSVSVVNGYTGLTQGSTPDTQHYIVGVAPADEATWNSTSGAETAIQVRYTTD